MVHTFEEISCGIMELRIGHIQLTRSKYLFVASIISAINLGTLALLVLGVDIGYYVGLFTSAIIGVFQGIVHSIGYLKENRKATGLGVGFYSAIPLAIVGLIVFVQIIQIL